MKNPLIVGEDLFVELLLNCLIAYNSRHIEFFYVLLKGWKVLRQASNITPWCLPRVCVRSWSETKRCWLLVGYYFHCMCHGLSNGGLFDFHNKPGWLGDIYALWVWVEIITWRRGTLLQPCNVCKHYYIEHMLCHHVSSMGSFGL